MLKVTKYEYVGFEYANKEKTTPDCFVPIPENK